MTAVELEQMEKYALELGWWVTGWTKEQTEELFRLARIGLIQDGKRREE